MYMIYVIHIYIYTFIYLTLESTHKRKRLKIQEHSLFLFIWWFSAVTIFLTVLLFYSSFQLNKTPFSLYNTFYQLIFSGHQTACSNSWQWHSPVNLDVQAFLCCADLDSSVLRGGMAGPHRGSIWPLEWQNKSIFPLVMAKESCFSIFLSCRSVFLPSTFIPFVLLSNFKHVSHGAYWSQICYISKVGFELLIFLLSLSKGWDYTCSCFSWWQAFWLSDRGISEQFAFPWWLRVLKSFQIINRSLYFFFSELSVRSFAYLLSNLGFFVHLFIFVGEEVDFWSSL